MKSKEEKNKNLKDCMSGVINSMKNKNYKSSMP